MVWYRIGECRECSENVSARVTRDGTEALVATAAPPLSRPLPEPVLPIITKEWLSELPTEVGKQDCTKSELMRIYSKNGYFNNNY